MTGTVVHTLQQRNAIRLCLRPICCEDETLLRCSRVHCKARDDAIDAFGVEEKGFFKAFNSVPLRRARPNADATRSQVGLFTKKTPIGTAPALIGVRNGFTSHTGYQFKEVEKERIKKTLQ